MRPSQVDPFYTTYIMLFFLIISYHDDYQYIATISFSNQFDCPHNSLQQLLTSLFNSFTMLVGFFVMRISIDRDFRVIGKIIFFVNRILLLALHLALIFSNIRSLWYLTRHIVSVLWFGLTQLAKALEDLAALTSDQRSLTLFFGLYSCF